MKTVAPIPSHPAAHGAIGEHHPVKQFWIAFTLASMGALGFAALALAAVMSALTLFG